MNYENIMWQYVARALNEKFWSNKVKDIPVFLKPLGSDHLGDFRFTPFGLNSIILSNNADLSPKEMVGVLAHEMTHQWVFQNYGCEVEEHGKEWMSEILRIGFDEENLDGLTFCDDSSFATLMSRHDEMINDSKRDI
mgnify:CR=1 FL=1